MALTVAAPGLVRREGAGLALTVLDSPSRFVALEVAAAPALLRDDARAMRTPATFWASWVEPALQPPGRVAVPAPVWGALRTHDRLYYRAHSSATPDRWTDHVVSLPDEAIDAAPHVRLCDGWVVPNDLASEEEVSAALVAAANHPHFDVIEGGTGLAALVCVHRFSPRRPVEIHLLEWVVALQSTTPPVRRTLVERLAFTNRALVAAHVVEEHVDQPAASMPSVNLVAALETEAQRWLKRSLGPFTVFQDNAPLPGEDGGTCVTLAPSSRCVYFAWTTWSGEPQPILPR